MEGIASQIDSWITEMESGKDQSVVTFLSKSVEVDTTLAAGMATLSDHSFDFGHIIPGEEKASSTVFNKIIISDDCPDSTLIDFRVEISSFGYRYWRDTFQIKVGYGFISGTDDLVLPSENDIFIFPNPTSDILNITGLTQPAEIQLYSIQGRFVKSFNQVESTVDISDLPAGVYILKLSSGNIHKTERIIKKESLF